MSRRSPSAGLLALAAALLFQGCGSARRDAPFTGPQTPPNAEILLGARVFASSCNGCHPGGTQGIGPALNNKPLPTWLMRFQVRHGLGAMPAFGSDDISDAQLDALLDYLVWLRRLDTTREVRMD
jgi:mono/diheme cytochrome c family protein